MQFSPKEIRKKLDSDKTRKQMQKLFLAELEHILIRPQRIQKLLQ